MGEDMVSDSDKPVTTLAEKLNHLFTVVHPAGQGEYSIEHVCRAIEQAGGPTISTTYLWQLRKGQRDNPTKKHLEALATFFGVSPAYFFDDDLARQIQAELDLLATLRDSGVRRLAFRASGLSPDSLAVINEVISRVRKGEGLPERPDSDFGGADDAQI